MEEEVWWVVVKDIDGNWGAFGISQDNLCNNSPFDDQLHQPTGQFHKHLGTGFDHAVDSCFRWVDHLKIWRIWYNIYLVLHHQITQNIQNWWHVVLFRSSTINWKEITFNQTLLSLWKKKSMARNFWTICEDKPTICVV